MKKQIGGNHYAKHKIQPWDIIDEYNLDYYLGNVLKYVLRAKDKNGIEDLKKAQHYLEYVVQKEQRIAKISMETARQSTKMQKTGKDMGLLLTTI